MVFCGIFLSKRIDTGTFRISLCCKRRIKALISLWGTIRMFCRGSKSIRESRPEPACGQEARRILERLLLYSKGFGTEIYPEDAAAYVEP